MAAAAAIDLHNIQGDIIPGLPKKTETFFFFEIKQVDHFRAHLLKLVPLITSADDANRARDDINKHKKNCGGLLPIALLNFALSSRAMKKLGLNDNIQDADFTNGQFADAEKLGDNASDWEAGFKGTSVDGVMQVAGDSTPSIDRHLEKALAIFGDSIKKVMQISGHVRPGKEDGHEHFGFLDGISNPVVQDIDKSDLSGQGFLSQGVIFLGREGDPNKATRPSWALDGSFLAFRYLQQLVPEFNLAVTAAAPPTSVSLAGARMVGRWKSGAPIQLSPLADNPALAADPERNNKFFFEDQSQEVCPFAAHIRKMNPRGDGAVPPAAIANHRVMRRGIQFGPELTHAEQSAGKTMKERGLLFVSYQSLLSSGFAFLQKAWADNEGFPPKKLQKPGLDPIIGQAAGSDTRVMSGLALGDPAKTFTFNKWVVSKGGEYFFVPSISVVKNVIAKPGDL
nr:dye decolorizing peroxidase [uncultured fungus]